MDYLRAEGLSLQLGQRDIFQSVSLTLSQGQRIGLVGRNGAGKTSLLDILTGKAKPTEGVVTLTPGVRLSYVQQTPLVGEGTLLETAQSSLAHLRELEQSLRDEEKRLATGEGSLEHYAKLTTQFETAGGYHAETDLETLLFEFGFTEAQFEQPLTTLSGGEGARLKLVMALAEKPDVLLLDEPSNHLDLKLRRKLAARLAKFPNALLLASHDRALLDAVCTHIGQLANGSLSLYKGNYSQFRARQLQMQRSGQKQSKQRAKEVAHLQAAQTRLQGWGTPKAQRQRRQIEGRLEKLEPLEETFSNKLEPSPHSLSLQSKRVRGTLLKAQHLGKSYSDKPAVDDVSFSLDAGDKVALVGPNGSGKSTLLGLISGEQESEHPKTEFYWHTKSKLAVFDQQSRGVNDNETPLAQLEHFVSKPRAELLLALVGIPQTAWATLPKALSGGERARLGLALLMASEANILLLDEPTNDLDIATIETLESTLADTDATVLFTSHDERLIEKVATRVWSLEAGELLEYRGGVKGYFDNRLRREKVELVTEEPDSAAAEISLEALELERLSLEAQLLDPTLLSEREQARVQAHYAELLNDLSLRYDAELPDPLPRYSGTLWGVRVSTNGFEAESSVAQFETSGAFKLRLFRPQSSGIGHLQFIDDEGSFSLPWARVAALETATRLAFERLDVSALQLQTVDNLEPLGFKNAGDGWWVLSLSRYESRLGYRPLDYKKLSKRGRRKRGRRKRTRHNRARRNIKKARDSTS